MPVAEVKLSNKGGSLSHAEIFGHPSSMLMDPVHEGIPLYAHERSCIDHALFQRLRWIVQNDITSFVFPGATHTRFQHSIGAMHIAGLVFRGIVQQHLAEKAEANLLDIRTEDREAINYLLYCLRLAALFHDTGHFPFSHQLERQPVFGSLIRSAEVRSRLWAKSRFSELARFDNVHHETYSVRVAAEILDDVGLEAVAAEDVLCLMENSTVSPGPRFSKGAAALCRLLLKHPREVPDLEGRSPEFIATFLRTLVSGEVDVDKMDYLLRDSFFAGCHYGFYNLSRLISTMRIGFDFREPAKPWVGMAITEKGVKDLEDLCYSRFQLYQQIYSHKTVVGFKWLLQEAIGELLIADEHAADLIRDAVSDLGEFVHFTDSFLWERLRAFAKRNPESAAAHLIQRKKLDYLETAEDLDDGDIRNRVDELSAANCGCKVVHFESPIKFSKIGPGFFQIKVLSRNRNTNRRQLDSLQSHSSFFSQFGAGVSLTHFFKRPNLAAR